MGVMEAVGEEEDRESEEEAALRAIREEEEAPSDADPSLLISSLLLRDTAENRLEGQFRFELTFYKIK